MSKNNPFLPKTRIDPRAILEQFEKATKENKSFSANEALTVLSEEKKGDCAEVIIHHKQDVKISKKTIPRENNRDRENKKTSNIRQYATHYYRPKDKLSLDDGGFEMDIQVEPYQKPVNLLSKAIAFLSYREHSEQELRQKLYRYTDDDNAIDEVIARLQKENWQSDMRFAENFVTSKQSKWGNQKIIHALHRHDLDEETVVNIKETLKETEYARALAVWEKKFQGQLAHTPQEKAKQMRFLASRGFSAEVVRKIVG